MKKLSKGRFGDFLQKISPDTKKFLIFAFVCLFIKLALTSWRAIYAIPNGLSDDGLMQNSAIAILDLHWFGGFNAFTLCKRNIFSFYLAGLNALGIPLLFANEILYFIAVLVIVFLIKKYTNKKWPLYVAFGVLFFNPATFATSTSVRIYRDAVYPAITLITLGSLFHVLTNIKNKKPFKGWFITYVVSLVIFWFLREESIWITPILAFCTLIGILFLVKRKDLENKKRIILKLILTPILSVLVLNLGFRIVNLAVYGEFVVTEDQSSAYQDFYNAIGKINSDARTDTIDLPTDVRNKIYEVSPTFATIKDNLENEVFPTIKVHGDNPEEINSGWTTWAIRQAMASAGYYKEVKLANAFYEQVALEIKIACDEGKLECTNHKPGLVETILGNISRLTGEVFDSLKYVYTFSGTEVKQWYSEPEPMVLGEASETLTGENMMSSVVNAQENRPDSTHFTMFDKIKIKILKGVRAIYKYLSPVLFWAAAAMFVIMTIKYLFVVKDGQKFYQRPQFDLIVFSVSILVALLIRCLIVAYLNITAFNAISDLYLYTGYSLLLVFDVMVFALLVSAFSDIKRRKVKNEEKQ